MKWGPLYLSLRNETLKDRSFDNDIMGRMFTMKQIELTKVK